MPIVIKKEKRMSTPNKSKIMYSPPKLRGSCFETHKPLNLGKGLQIHGGSCITPMILDADIYIGFDAGIKKTSKRFPWTEGHEVNVSIPDGSVPSYETMVGLVEWTIQELEKGKKIHAGCIGGHGRTGTYFSVLVHMITGEKDASSYVRENYCSKAIESQEQIQFLSKKFGITPVSERKMYTYPLGGPSQSYYGVPKKYGSTKALRTTGSPICTKGNIWGVISKCN